MGKKRDWQKAEDYEFVKSLPKDLQAWEFLRRNPKYKKEWEEELSTWLEHMNSLRKALREEGKNGFARCLKGLWDGLPDDVFNRNWVFAMASQVEGLEELVSGHPSFSIPSMRARENWGIAAYVNPEQDSPGDVLTFTDTNYRVLNRIIKQGDKTAFFKETEVVYVFDLALSIKAQLQEAGRALRHEQNKHKINIVRSQDRSEQWSIYLRVWDAYNELGPKPSKIASVLYPNYDEAGNRVSHNYHRAKDLIDGGYRKIILPSPKRK